MEQLYSAILEGRLDLRLPLANGQIPDRSILLSRLVAMEAQQHVRLQVSCCNPSAPHTLMSVLQPLSSLTPP